MAAMSYAEMPTTEVRAGRYSYALDDSEDFLQGQLVGVDSADDLLKPWQDVATMLFLGFLLDFENSGNGVSDAADPDAPEGRVNENGDTLTGVALGGTPVVGAEVYCATDNYKTDISTVATTNTKPIGTIKKITGSGVGNVGLYTPEEYAIHA